MAASYPTSVKSFSSKSTTDVVEASHINDLQDEVNAIESALLTGGLQHDVKTTGWTDYSATSTITGWSAFTTKKVYYKKVGRLVFVNFNIVGTSNATSASFTVPHARPADGFTMTFPLGGEITNNGSAVTTNAYGAISSAGSTVTTAQDAGATAWTNSGTKAIAGQFWYEAAS